MRRNTTGKSGNKEEEAQNKWTSESESEKTISTRAQQTMSFENKIHIYEFLFFFFSHSFSLSHSTSVGESFRMFFLSSCLSLLRAHIYSFFVVCMNNLMVCTFNATCCRFYKSKRPCLEMKRIEWWMRMNFNTFEEKINGNNNSGDDDYGIIWWKKEK